MGRTGVNVHGHSHAVLAGTGGIEGSVEQYRCRPIEPHTITRPIREPTAGRYSAIEHLPLHRAHARQAPPGPSSCESCAGTHGDFRGDGPPRSRRRIVWPGGTKRQSLASAGSVHALDRVDWRRSQTRLSIASTTDLGSSCSQNLSTSQPAVLSSRSCRRSRSTFAASFSSHQSRLACGVVPCTGHECQKQPSRNTATRSFVKTKSGRDRVTPGIVRSTRKRSPRRCSRLRTCISRGVSR